MPITLKTLIGYKPFKVFYIINARGAIYIQIDILTSGSRSIPDAT